MDLEQLGHFDPKIREEIEKQFKKPIQFLIFIKLI